MEGSGDAKITLVVNMASAFNEAGLHAVVPKMDCPHMRTAKEAFESKSFGEETFLVKNRSCSECEEFSAFGNWICLTCYQTLCGRDQKEHMMKHNLATGHSICMSFDDLSFWCYSCDSYVDHLSDELRPIYRRFHIANFGEDIAAFMQ